MNKSAFAKGALHNFSVKIITVILILIEDIFINRILHPEGKGILTVVIIYQALFLTIGSLSLDSSIRHFFNDKRFKKEEFAGISLFLSLVIGCMLILLIWGSYHWNSELLYKNISFAYIIFVAVPLPLLLGFRYLCTILQMQNLIDKYNSLFLAQGIIHFVLVMLLIGLGRLTILNVVLVHVIQAGFVFILSTYWVVKQLTYKLQLNFKLMKLITWGGVKLHLGTIAGFIYYKIDVLMINSFLNPASVGHYRVATNIVELLVLIPTAILTTAYPTVINATSQAEAESNTEEIARHTFFIMLICGLLLSLLAKYAILIVGGKEYLPGYAPLLIMISGMVFHGVQMNFAPICLKMGVFGILSLSAVVLSLVNIGLNYILLPKIEIIGAAIATSLTHLLGVIFCYFIVRYYSINIKFAHIFSLRRSDLGFYSDLWNNILQKISRKKDENIS